MRKSTLFISAALTTFVLAVLAAGVASAFQAVTSKPDLPAPQPQQQTPVSEKLARNVVAPEAVVLSPEQAAQLVAQMTGQTDLYSVETTTLNGVEAYLVTFSSGNLVYISPTGQILSTPRLQTAVASVPGGGGGGGHKSGGGGGGEDGGSEGGEHEGGESGGGDD